MSKVTAATLPSFRDESFSAATRSILAAVPQWWSHKAVQAGLEGRWLDVRYGVRAQPPGEIPFVEPAAAVGTVTTHEELGLLYVSSLPTEERSKSGKHYTPSLLAGRLWDMAREGLGLPRGRDKRLSGLVRDPACGAGALLLPPLREHLRAAVNDDPTLLLRSLPSLIEGVDTDPWSVWLTNVILGAELLHVVAQVPEARREPIPALAKCGDGLALRENKAIATVMNPPYGRLQLAAKAREDFAHILYGHANIYGMFIASGAENTQLGGVMACLVPTSFTAGRYFHKLRGHLAETMPLHAISFVEGRNGVFAGVLQETCLATFKHTRTRKVEVTRSNGSVEQVAAVPVPATEHPWLLPREARDAALAAAAASMPLTLNEAGWHASTGPLVWNRRKGDLHSRKGKNRAMVLWGADIDGGVVHRDRARDSMRYLSLSSPSDPKVMVLAEPVALVQRTTAPEQKRRVVCAELSQDALDMFGGRVVIENHLNVLRPNSPSPLLSLSTLTRVLQTQTIDRLMRCISGSVAVSSYEIGSLPLPEATVLESWESLSGDDLERAVKMAYTPGRR